MRGLGGARLLLRGGRLRDMPAATKAVRAKQKAARPKSPAERAADKEIRQARANVLAALKRSGITRAKVEATAGGIVVRLTLGQARALAER